MRRLSSAATFALLAVLSISMSGNARASIEGQTQIVSPMVQAAFKSKKNVDLMIHLREEADLRGAWLFTNRGDRIRFVYEELVRTAERSQANLIEKLRNKGIRFRAFHIQNSIHIEDADEGLARSLASLPEVRGVSLNTKVRLDLPKLPKMLESQNDNTLPSNLTLIGVDRVWNELGVRGEGIVIAGQDSGYDWQHPSLKQSYRGLKSDGTVDHNYNWHDAIGHRIGRAPNKTCPPRSPAPCDDTDHGTHTMGTMVGDAGATNRIGVAPKAKWIGCRNMDKGEGTPATYLECFEYFLAPYPIGGDPRSDGRPDLAPHIINNSWSCPKSEGCEGDELIGTVRALSAAGILVVVAAGNNGPGCGTLSAPPGSYYGDVLVVGAYNNWSKDIAYFSNRGPSSFNGSVGIDVVAPGVGIRSSVQTGKGYDEKSGTSMAAPHVAGVAALLWSARPELIGNITATVERIRNSSTPMKSGETCGKFSGSAIPNATFGHGMINAREAIR